MTSNFLSDDKDGWAWFATDNNQGVGETLPDIGKELTQNYARCFSTVDGQKVLTHLRAITLNRALGPKSKSSLLRHLEGQRQLVSFVEAQINRGRHGG